MRIKLNDDLRKFIDVEVEVGEEVLTFKYYERNTRQIREVKEKTAESGVTLKDLDSLNLKHFHENFCGRDSDKKVVHSFYEEKGNLYDFITSLDNQLLGLKE